ncbi:hypothetical protein RND81_03G022200 [Saponaria officinalis]
MSNKQKMFHETSEKESSSQLHDKTFQDDLSNKSSGPYLKRHSSILSAESDPHSNNSSNHDSGGSKSMDIDSKERSDRCHARLPLPNDQLLSPIMGKSSQSRTDQFERREPVAQFDVNLSSHISSRKLSTSVPLNAVSSSIPAVFHPPKSDQVAWFSDGDAAAMDVFSATRQLWLGSLAPDVSEAGLRFELERFGRIENFMFFHVKGFVLVEYERLSDAIKAREYLHRYPPCGYPIRVKFIDIGLGTRGAVNGVAIGSSCHVFVGNVLNQWMKDEIVREIMKLNHRGPRVVTELTSEGALLLDFENPEEAANAMFCIRQLRKGDNSFGAAIVGRTDISRPCPSFWNSAPTQFNNNIGNMCNTYLGSPHGQTAGSPSHRMQQSNIQFNMNPESVPPEFQSPRGCFGQGSTLRTGQFIHSNVSASVCMDTPGPAPGASTQIWLCQKSEAELQTAGEVPTHTAVATQGSAIALPQPIQNSPYVQPFYPLPSNSWDAHGFSHPNLLNIVPPSVMSSNVHSNHVPPIVQASATPFSHVSESDIHSYSQNFPQPIGPPFPSMPQPQFDLPPPLPPSPLIVPPPPNSPPPPPPTFMDPSTTETSSLVNAVCSPQFEWQGTLSKSGVQFCSIYAHKLDSDLCRYSVSVSEPAGWPMKLDMTKRTDYRHVKASFTSTPAHKREVCQLFPSSMADHKGFQDFISYLKQRDCAGVIKMPSMKSLWARLLFILPYSPEACSMLSVKPNTTDCLFAVVLPKEANTE